MRQKNTHNIPLFYLDQKLTNLTKANYDFKTIPFKFSKNS